MTTASAWGIAAFGPLKQTRRGMSTSSFDFWRQSIRPSDVFLPWLEAATLTTPEPRRDAQIMGLETCGWWGGKEPARSSLAVDRLDIYASWASNPVRAPSRSLAVVRSGWPLPALSCAGEWTLAGHAAGATGYFWRWGVELPELPDVVAIKTLDGPLPLKKLQRPLPLHPLWPGFVVDTALYGGVAYVLAFAPGAARRAWRRRRGRCCHCGYDLRRSPSGPCPECGS